MGKDGHGIHKGLKSVKISPLMDVETDGIIEYGDSASDMEFNEEAWANMVFVPFFISPQFKKATGYKKVVKDADRKSYDYEDFYERINRYDTKSGKSFFLKIIYQKDFRLSNDAYGVLNSEFLRGVIDMDIVRQVRITSGINEGSVLFSFQPEYGSVERMERFLREFIQKLDS